MTDISDAIFLFVFFVMVFAVPYVVVKATYDEGSRVDLRELWMHKGRIDKFAVILLGTWWVHTSSMVLWTLVGAVKTQDYVTYMGWAIPIITKMFAPSTPEPPAQPQTGAAPAAPQPQTGASS